MLSRRAGLSATAGLSGFQVTFILRSLHWLKIITNALNANSSYSPISLQFSQPANRTTYTTVIAVQFTCRIALHLLLPFLNDLHPPYYKSPSAVLDMHRLTC